MKALIRSVALIAIVAALLSGAPAFAADAIHNGVDLWMTVAGFAQTSFADQPIPAGFFCEGSQPFTGTVKFQGVPFATEPAKSLGGTYSAPLALNVKAVFTPVGGDKSARREVTRRIDLGPGSHSVWAYVQAPQYPSSVKIDTDGDGEPDTVLPASSNFVAGVSPAVLKGQAPSRPHLAATMSTDSTRIACPVGQCAYQSCHCSSTSTDPYQSSSGCASDHLHCIWTCVTCTTTVQPLDPTLNPAN